MQGYQKVVRGCLLAGWMLSGGWVLGQTVLVDFGNDSSFRGVSVTNPDANGRYWNSVFSGAFYANMVDTANAATTIDLGFDAAPATDSFNGPAGATSVPPTPSEIAATAFDAAALGALGATNAVFDYYVDARFQLQGLDVNRTYTLTFFGSHKFSTDDATTYALCTDNTYGTVLQSTNLNIQVPGQPWRHNSNTVAVVSNVVPRAGGVIYVKFIGANGNAGYLNALRIEVDKATPTLGVRANQEVVVGASSVTLTGVVAAAGGLVAANGETVRVTINGVTQNATVSGGAGGFSLSYPVSSLGMGTYPITYAYGGNASSLFGTTNAATTLTVVPDYQTVLIDIGNSSSFRGVSVPNPDENGRYWNSVWSAAFYADMVNASNQSTRIDLGFDGAAGTDSFNGPAGATTQPPTPSELAATAFNAAALGDLGATNAVFDFYINSQFQLQGLETGLTYRLTFFGSHKFSTDDATTYALCTDNTYATTVASVNLNVQTPGSPSLHNTDAVAVLDGMAPQADGKLYVKFQGANGNSGYLNALKVQWVKAPATISGVAASQSVPYGTSSVTLTGTVGAANIPAQAGESVSVTVNGSSQSAMVGSGGAFSVSYPTATLAAGAHVVTYAYAGSSVLKGATNATTTLTVTKLTPTLGARASQSVSVGTASVTLTGRVSAAGGVVPANGEIVRVTINGATQNASIAGGAGGFSLSYAISSLGTGTYPITYAYWGNASSLFGTTNATTVLTVTPVYQTVLVDLGNNSSFRGTNVVNPDVNGRTWNSVWAGAFYADLADESNAATRVDFGFDAAVGTDSFNGPGGVYDPESLGELGVTNAVDDYYINSRFQLQGLETGLTYRLSFFGSHKFSTDDATVYALCTDNTYATTTTSVSLNVQVPGSPNLHNTGTVAVLENVVPQADGKLYVAFRGANGNSGYLNALRVQWVKGTSSVSGVTASQSVPYGTTSVTLTGVVGGLNVPAQAGEVVGVTINGVKSNALVGAGGTFSVNYPVSALAAGTYTITYAYTGSTVLKGSTNATTSLAVTKLTPTFDVKDSQSVAEGTASVTLTGLLSAAGGVVVPNGNTVRVRINGVQQNATVSGGAGAFTLNYTLGSLTSGIYTITYAFEGTTSFYGTTNESTILTVRPVYQTVLVDMGNDSSFRGVSVTNPDENGRTWNSVHSGAFYADLADQSNVTTRVDLGFDAAPATDSFNGPAGATTQPPTPSELAATVFDASALGELGATNAVFDYYVNSRFQLQGLETGLVYRLSFFGSHKFSTDDATVYALCTDNTYATTTTAVSLNVQVPGSPNLHNTGTVAVLENVVPQVDGKLYVAFRGANGNSGYLNALRVQWVKGTSSVSGVTSSQSVPYGTTSVTLTGVVGGLNVSAQAGEVVGVTINGVKSNALVGAGGTFSVNYPVSSLPAGTYAITYAYAGSTVLKGSTNATTSLTVTKLTPTLGVKASSAVAVGTPSVTLTGVVSAAGGVVAANGSTVRVTIDGVTQNATVAGGAGGFSLSYPVSGLAGGVYTITYAYWGNASSLNGVTNSDTQLTITQATQMLIDFGRHDGVNGRATSNPDGNGNYWNNLSSRAADNVVTSGTKAVNLVTISGVATPVAVEVISSGWLANGRANGGLFSPNGPAFGLLGNFAIETATEDYFYIDGAGLTKSLRLSGLNPSASYNLRFFGTRDTASTRQTTYTVNGHAVGLTTSGTGIGNNGVYNGNDDEIVALNNLSPTMAGELEIAVTVTAGGFAYLGVLEITDNAGFCPIHTPVIMPRPANQTVYATGSANLSFAVTATDSGGCVAPALQVYGLPSGATVNPSVSGSSRASTFSWTPNPGQEGTYPVRFEATDVNEGGTTSFVMLVYVGQVGEGSSGGIPHSQTNWSVVVEEIPPSGANGDLTWTATPGIVYDVYYSDSDPAGNMSWQYQGQVTADASAESLTVPESARRYYKVVPAGESPNKIGLWGIVRPTLPIGFSMRSAPLDLADRSMGGELGNALKAVLSNGDRVYAMEANGSFTTITLAGGAWDTAYTFAEGQGFFVQSASGATPRFAGPVGNDGSANRTINGAANGRWNILGLSQGKTLSFSSAFATGSFTGTPTGDWDETVSDLVVIDQGNGNWKRIMRTGSSTWLDLDTFSTPSVSLTPGSAVYYFHYGNSALSINF